MDSPSFADLSKSLLRRAMISSLQQANTTDAERAQLAAGTPPIIGRSAQDYVAWRRAVLWVSAVVLSIALVLAMADHKGFAEGWAGAQLKAQAAAARHQGLDAPIPDREQIHALAEQVVQNLGKSNVELIDNLQAVHLAVKIVVVVLAFLAARSWKRVGRSRGFARWAWVIGLLVPLAMAAYPWANSLEFGQVGVDVEGVRQKFAAMFGLFYLLMLLPKLLSIFPGIMRSALTMKTLLPESMQTGWMTVLTAPLFMGMLLLILCVLSQAQASLVVVAAFACLAAAPCIYLYNARELLLPHPVADAERLVHQIRRPAFVCTALGIVLLGGYALQKQLVPGLTLAEMLFEAFGGVLLTMVAFSDLLLAVLRFELKQSAAFAGSELEKSYGARLAELDQTGLTDIAAALRLRDKEAVS